MKFENILIQDGGTDLIRTRAATTSRIKQHVLKNYTPGDSYATCVANSCGSVDLVAADAVQSGASGATRVTTFAAKSITLTANSSQYDQGTATAGGASTLTDSSKAFGVNAHATRALVITGGTGAGQSRRIVSNTATVLTVDTPWGTNPDATSTYAIRDDLHIAILDSVSSDVLIVTDETNNQVLASGNTFSAPSWTRNAPQPT